MLASRTLVIAVVPGVDDKLPAADEKAVLRAAEELRQAIAGKDVARIFALTHSKGIGCIDASDSKADFGHRLRTPGDGFHVHFFDTKRLRERVSSVSPVLSARGFFLQAKGIRATAHDSSRRRRSGERMACVIYTADDPPQVTPMMEFCFEEDGHPGMWRLVQPPGC